MSDLYLIAHKVRGESAFDVAVRMECPECLGNPEECGNKSNGCSECDSLGYWWIIPTSGHRAYPYWSEECSTCVRDWVDIVYIPCPSALPDHYTTRADPSRPKLSDLFKPKPFTMNRRI